MIQITVRPFDLNFCQVFAVSGSARSSTKSLFLEIQVEGVQGFGQAAFPPYLQPDRDDNLRFLQSWPDWELDGLSSLSALLDDPEFTAEAHLPARAALDMAWHDIRAKQEGLPLWQFLGLPDPAGISSCFTIGIGSRAETETALKQARKYSWLKLKLDADLERTRSVIDQVRRFTEQPFAADFNQAFTGREVAVRALEMLWSAGAFLAEQPMAVKRDEDQLWLRERCPLPIYGDESIRTEQDLIRKRELFDGINIKLMKCGGLRAALRLHELAGKSGVRTLLGCMAESSLATTAAANLASLFDYADLDGHAIINNDPFRGLMLPEGRVELPGGAGVGAYPA